MSEATGIWTEEDDALVSSQEDDETLAGVTTLSLIGALGATEVDDYSISDQEDDDSVSATGSTAVVTAVAQVTGGLRRRKRWVLPNGMHFYGTELEVQSFLDAARPKPVEPPKVVEPRKAPKPREQPTVELVRFREPVQLTLRLEENVLKQPPIVWPAKVQWPVRHAQGLDFGDSDACIGGATTYWDPFNFDGKNGEEADGLEATAKAGFWFPRLPPRQPIVIEITQDFIDYILEEA